MTDYSINFVAGGDVQASDGLYIKRPADDELFNLCIAGKFSYVLTSRQIGKSSLKNEVARRLEQHGISVARIDLNRIGQNIRGINEWYFNLADQIVDNLQIKTNLDKWWDTQSKYLTPNSKFLRFLEYIILKEISTAIVIFIDEIDMTLGLDYRDDFFASIRVMHNDRSQYPQYKRLTFILLGVATPDELIKDPQRTPFNIGKSINLTDFTYAECDPFRQVIEEEYPKMGNEYFEQIYKWTNGHPYLTQKLCLELATTKNNNKENLIDGLVNRIFFAEKDRPDDNLRFVQTRILGDSLALEMLSIYRQILQGRLVSDNEKSVAINHLKLYGLVVAKNGKLIVRNKIYQTVFDILWTDRETNNLAVQSKTTRIEKKKKIAEIEFVVGGTMRADDPTYVTRSADDELLSSILRGDYCYVLTARQMGKSSLMIRTSMALKREGFVSAIVDIQGIGTRRASEWFYSFLSQLRRGLRLNIDLEDWGEKHFPSSGFSKGLFDFLFQVVLVEISEPIVIFIDEIDWLRNIDFRDDFFSVLRAFFNSRAEYPDTARLRFVLFGVARPQDLISDSKRTPFNIGVSIALSDFTYEEAHALAGFLKGINPIQRDLIFNRIYYWTDGHPYLTQKMFRNVAERIEEGKKDWDEQQVDEIANELYGPREARMEANLKFVSDTIISHPQSRNLLTLYRSIYRDKKVSRSHLSVAQDQLILSGIVKEKKGYLEVRNMIYRKCFNMKWIKENSRPKWLLRLLR